MVVAADHEVSTGNVFSDLGLPDSAELIAKAELARQIAAMPPLSIQITKGMINGAYDVGLDAMLETESTASPFCAQTAAFRDRAGSEK